MTPTTHSKDENGNGSGNGNESGNESGNGSGNGNGNQCADRYEIDTDPDRIDIALVHHWLSTDAFWALGRSRDLVERSMRGSLNFGVYGPDGAQVAYARVVTDRATFAWLCDVYVDPAHRGRGLGVRLATAVRDHLAPYELKRTLLATLDAHELYEKVGFVPVPDPQMLMTLSADNPAR